MLYCTENAAGKLYYHWISSQGWKDIAEKLEGQCPWRSGDVIWAVEYKDIPDDMKPLQCDEAGVLKAPYQLIDDSDKLVAWKAEIDSDASKKETLD